MKENIFELQYTADGVYRLLDVDHTGYAVELQKKEDDSMVVSTVDGADSIVSVGVAPDSGAMSESRQMLFGKLDEYNIDWEIAQQGEIAVLSVVNNSANDEGLEHVFNTVTLNDLSRDDLNPQKAVVKSIVMKLNTNIADEQRDYPFVLDIKTEDSFMPVPDNNEILRAGNRYFLSDDTELINWNGFDHRLFDVNELSYLQRVDNLPVGEGLWQKGDIVSADYNYVADTPKPYGYGNLQAGDLVKKGSLQNILQTDVCAKDGAAVSAINADTTIFPYKIQDDIFGNAKIPVKDLVSNAREFEGFGGFFESLSDAMQSANPIVARDCLAGNKLHKFTVYLPDMAEIAQNSHLNIPVKHTVPMLATGATTEQNGDHTISLVYDLSSENKGDIYLFDGTDEIMQKIDSDGNKIDAEISFTDLTDHHMIESFSLVLWDLLI